MREHLQFENVTLRQQLEALLQEARENEGKLRRFDQFERRLIGARSFCEVVRLLLEDYRTTFDIEHVSLTLVDTECEAARVLAEHCGGQQIPGLVLLRSAEQLLPLYGHAPRTLLCPYDAGHHASLFVAPPGTIASVALLPLQRGSELIGSLNLGSAAAGRYGAAAGTDFLDRLAAIVAVCLDNALTHERLKHAGLTDALTGVQNRRYFEHRSLAEVSQARRHRQPLACMFLDIDRFKRINDTYGHQTGDDVLRGIAEVIRVQMRASDTIARYGGEEFVALLPLTSLSHALEIAERIRAAVATRGFRAPGGSAVPVTISIGIAMLEVETGTVDNEMLAAAMIAAADRALYDAKHGGRNRVVASGTAELPAAARWSVLPGLAGWLARGAAACAGWLRQQQRA